jgi:hypothetical protein
MKNVVMYVCKVWAKVHAALALGPTGPIGPPLPVYPSVSPTFLMRRQTSVWGRHGSRLVP